ncbi:hypothetical protein [Kosakonia cowanii]|uniref:hypothetical protein n=1 Tax=Kosakonia cowanii TaxID=208223 RepID=UPI001CEF6759|nr:hypothetical protein [Kosakonia cowanii]
MGFFDGIGKMISGATGWGDVIGGALGAAGSLFGSAMNNRNANHMASSAMQTRIKDMKAAGLNPILAAQNGGLQAASVPQQQSYDTSQFTQAYSAHSARMQAQTAQLQLQNQIKQTNSTVNLQNSQSASALADAQLKQGQLGIQNAQKDLINQQVLTEATRRANLAANTGLASANAVRANLQAMQDKVQADFWSSSDGQRTYRNNQMLGNSISSPSAWSNVFAPFFQPPSAHSASGVSRAVDSGVVPVSSSPRSWSFGPYRVSHR